MNARYNSNTGRSFRAEALESELDVRPAIEVVERIAHAARLRAPELRV